VIGTPLSILFEVQLPNYLLGFSGNSLSVEASKIGLWFQIPAVLYKVVYEEISLKWAGVESNERHLMPLSTIDHGAEETPSQQDIKLECLW